METSKLILIVFAVIGIIALLLALMGTIPESVAIPVILLSFLDEAAVVLFAILIWRRRK